MVESLGGVGAAFISLYEGAIGALPIWAQNFLNLFFWSLLVVVYAIFIWKFYRWIAKKDVLQLNLSRFNRSEHSVIGKIFGAAIYFVEYLVILPFVVFLWFGIFTIFLMLLTSDLPLETVLVVSVTVVAAIRMTSYYKEDLARDLAKTIPLTLLAVAVTQGLFDFGKVLEQISFLPGLFSDIWTYLIFIVIVEFLLRVLDIIFVAFDLYDDKEVKED
ncbi:MAG: hypothetical protein Q8Q04_01510 [archaeon]|nr:hypothetical protein [archaeon]